MKLKIHTKVRFNMRSVSLFGLDTPENKCTSQLKPWFFFWNALSTFLHSALQEIWVGGLSLMTMSVTTKITTTAGWPRGRKIFERIDFLSCFYAKKTLWTVDSHCWYPFCIVLWQKSEKYQGLTNKCRQNVSNFDQNCLRSEHGTILQAKQQNRNNVQSQCLHWTVLESKTLCQ